jgi:hypothetical protein
MVAELEVVAPVADALSVAWWRSTAALVLEARGGRLLLVQQLLDPAQRAA